MRLGLHRDPDIGQAGFSHPKRYSKRLQAAWIFLSRIALAFDQSRRFVMACAPPSSAISFTECSQPYQSRSDGNN
jgi:hypothetical protein